MNHKKKVQPINILLICVLIFSPNNLFRTNRNFAHIVFAVRIGGFSIINHCIHLQNIRFTANGCFAPRPGIRLHAHLNFN